MAKKKEQRRVEIFIFSLYFSVSEHCFPDTSIPENVWNANIIDSPVNELKEGQSKDIHICKRQPCAATFSSGLMGVLLSPRGTCDSAPSQLAECTAGTVQSRELSLGVSYEEWCYCLSLEFLKPLNDREGPFGVQAYWHRFSWKHIALWINIKWKGCNTT